MVVNEMRRRVTLALAATACLAFSARAQAAIMTHVPGDSVPPVVVSPAFAPLAVGGAAGTNYIDFGVDYSHGNVEGVFDDGGGVLAFSGVNAAGDVDLLTAVDGRIVVAGTTTQGLTSFLYAEAGFADDGALLLEVFDLNMTLLASAPNGPPLGPNGRTTFTIDRGGVYDIAFFRISTPVGDHFGVNEIRIEAPVGVPEPASLALVVLGVAGLGGARLRARMRRA